MIPAEKYTPRINKSVSSALFTGFKASADNKVVMAQIAIDKETYINISFPGSSDIANELNKGIIYMSTANKSKPLRLLDLFCKAGGASEGYRLAGFTVVGVDIEDQPNYPFEFHRADALTFPLDGFDAVHASPPCQHYTAMLNHGLTDRSKHPDLIAATREHIKKLPYVIENVAGARHLLRCPIMLCGEMFGLRVIRHRYFETNIGAIKQPPHPTHRREGAKRTQRDTGSYYYRVYGHETGKAEWGAAMGIDWMRSPELAQAIPPAYTRFIGKALYSCI